KGQPGRAQPGWAPGARAPGAGAVALRDRQRHRARRATSVTCCPRSATRRQPRNSRPGAPGPGRSPGRQQGRRRGDFVLAGAYFPVALCRSAVRFVLLSPLGLLSAGLVAAITIITLTLHPLPLAVGYGAGTLVAFFGLGPGSSGCRKPLARFFGAAARTPARTVTAFIVVCVLAIAAIAAAGSQPPVYWPAGNLSMQLAHMPGLHGVI